MKKTLTVTEARAKIYKLIDEVSRTHQTVTILGKRNNVVLISESDWSAVQETLYLTSIPKMRKSIKDGLATPPSDCSDDLEW